ncbi:MAG: urate hydroxylase PuuD [Gaiellaceae bacterium]
MAALVTAGLPAAALDPYVSDWLHLLLRWLHVIAGIAWIGSSFYFVFLDNSLLPPRDPDHARKGVAGELWSVHGGGFYHVQKYRVSPRDLPDPLHFVKWEAYATWLSGLALMIVLYYLEADVALIDRSVADLGTGTAVAISVGLLAAAWVVYDVLCRALGRTELLLGAVVVAGVVLAAWGAGELFSARAAYLQVGAMLGTIMSANVFFVIIPAHKTLVRAKQEGREPDPAPLFRAKQRSVHNNYVTLPVVFTMIAGHFPLTYGHERAWLVLVALMVIGAWVRHFFNLRHGGRTVVSIPVSAAVALVALAVAIEPPGAPKAEAGSEPVSFARVQEIVESRCASCHSSDPTSEAFTTAPLGVLLETPEQIVAQADAIERQAVLSTAMPLGNVTGMTQEERNLLGAWIEQGASAGEP